jgi:hypothetical protein
MAFLISGAVFVAATLEFCDYFHGFSTARFLRSCMPEEVQDNDAFTNKKRGGYLPGREYVCRRGAQLYK